MLNIYHARVLSMYNLQLDDTNENNLFNLTIVIWLSHQILKKVKSPTRWGKPNLPKINPRAQRS